MRSVRIKEQTATYTLNGTSDTNASYLQSFPTFQTRNFKGTQSIYLSSLSQSVTEMPKMYARETHSLKVVDQIWETPIQHQIKYWEDS